MGGVAENTDFFGRIRSLGEIVLGVGNAGHGLSPGQQQDGAGSQSHPGRKEFVHNLPSPGSEIESGKADAELPEAWQA